MLDWLKKYWPALALSLMLGVILDATISSLITCHPVGADPGGSTSQQQHQECTAFAGPIFLALIGFLDFLDKHGEAVTGVFTIVLAVFTGRLWFSTEKLWQVTERSLTTLERPWIFVHLRPHVIGKAEQYEVPKVAFTIANHGRMPGIIKECHIHLGRGEEGPESGLLADQHHGAIGPHERKECTAECPSGREYNTVVDIVTDEAHCAPQIGQDEQFFLYILIQYCDVAENGYTSSFCWRYDNGVDYWTVFEDPFGTKKYNYTT